MSDGEYDMEWDEGGDNDGWGEEGDDNKSGGGSDGAIEIENNFYEAEGMLKDNPQEALERFETVVTLEESRNESTYSFNSHKFIVILAAQLGQYDKMIKSQQNLMKMTDKASRNEVSEAINRILDLVETNLQEKSPEMAKEMYTLILAKLKTYNERLWFTTSLRLAQMYLSSQQFAPLEQMLVDLKTACLTPEAAASACDFTRTEVFDVGKGSMLLEVFSFEIQMCIELKEQRRMKQVFRLSQNFASTIEDPRVIGVIMECGGKMFMAEKKWAQALEQFSGSFKSLVECGSSRAKTLLKYTILAWLLEKPDFDVLSTQEAKIFSGDPEIIAMTTLMTGFNENDINTIQEVLNDKKVNLLGDSFIAQYLDELLRSVRLNAVAAICKPYKTVKLAFLARKMNVPVAEIRGLLSELILEEKLEGQIDQLKEVLELRSAEQQTAQKHRAMQDWGNKLLELHGQLVKQVEPKVATDFDEDSAGIWGY